MTPGRGTGPAQARTRLARPDVPALVAGLVIGALGGLLLLDFQGTIDLRFAALTPIVLASAGAILLALGLTREE